jgi:4-nitrophenyl phosphatase
LSEIDRCPVLREIKGLIIDMDGVLWRGDQPIPGLLRFFDVLRERGLKYVLATNNPLRTPAGFAERATRLGIPICADQVITATTVTVRYLSDHYPAGTRVHVISEPPLKQLVTEAGFVLADDLVEVVVVSMDFSMTYETLKHGALLIRNGADFIATNPDPYYPSEEGLVPAAGAFVLALAASTEREPVVMGKPESPIFELALERIGLPSEQVAVLGDCLTSDIGGGNKVGLKTILVLTGVTTREMLASGSTKPSCVFSSIVTLSNVLEELG